MRQAATHNLQVFAQKMVPIFVALSLSASAFSKTRATSNYASWNCKGTPLVILQHPPDVAPAYPIVVMHSRQSLRSRQRSSRFAPHVYGLGCFRTSHPLLCTTSRCHVEKRCQFRRLRAKLQIDVSKQQDPTSLVKAVQKLIKRRRRLRNRLKQRAPAHRTGLQHAARTRSH